MTTLDQQDYYLIKIMEECAEIQHIICKSLRFGIHDSHPTTGDVNRERLESEVKDLLVALNEASYRGYIRIVEIPQFEGYKEREDKLLKYLNVSKKLGRVR